MVLSVTHERSPRVLSHEWQRPNKRDSEKTTRKEDHNHLVKFFVVGLLVVSCWILDGIAKIYLIILFQKLGLMALAPALKDTMVIIEEKNAMCLDQYMIENSERRAEENERQ